MRRARRKGEPARPGDVLDLAARHGARMVDLKFTDLPGTWQHMGMALASTRRGSVQRGDRLRRLLDPRLPGDLRVGHAADARPVDGDSRPVLRSADRSRSSARCSTRSRASRTRATRATSRSRRRSTCAPPASRTSATSAPRRSSTSSTTWRSTSRRNTAFYEVDSEEGHWTSGQGFQRRGEGLSALGYTNRSQEGYFPAPPNDTLSDLRGDDGDGARGARDPDREPSPRGRRSGPGRDRPALPAAARDGGRAPAAQVRRQEHGEAGRQDRRPSCPSRSSRRTAPGCTSTSRCGRTARRSCTTPTATRCCPRSRSTTRPACWRTRTRCSRSARRRRTPTAGWSPATRRRSCSSTRSATGRRP